MELLIATNNRGKQREFAGLLAPNHVVTPANLGLKLNVEETGTTFAANAEIKAKAFCAASGRLAVADDSGLEVDALNGAPGVLSARFGGPHLDDAQRCEVLLQRLEQAPTGSSRNARFRCCVVAVAPDGRLCAATGTCSGQIAPAPRGDGGFGYDPVFLLPDLDLTMAEISAELKNRISHRARALQALLPLLMETFPELNLRPPA